MLVHLLFPVLYLASRNRAPVRWSWWPHSCCRSSRCLRRCSRSIHRRSDRRGRRRLRSLRRIFLFRVVLPLLQPPRVIFRAQLLIPRERHPRVAFWDGKAICTSFICSVKSGGAIEPGEDCTPDTRGCTGCVGGYTEQRQGRRARGCSYVFKAEAVYRCLGNSPEPWRRVVQR